MIFCYRVDCELQEHLPWVFCPGSPPVEMLQFPWGGSPKITGTARIWERPLTKASRYYLISYGEFSPLKT